MKNVFLFLFFALLFTGLFARKPIKSKAVKHPKIVHKAAAPVLLPWSADYTWYIDDGIKNLEFRAKPSTDKELKAMVKYLFLALKKDTTKINFSLVESEVEKPVAAIQAEKRFVLYNPQKLNIDLYGPHAAGILYQIGHHILLHTAQMNEKQAVLAADSFYGYCITTNPSLVASGHGTHLMDSIPETNFKPKRVAAMKKGIEAGKESMKTKMSEERKKMIAEAKARAIKQKRFYVFVFLIMIIVLLGIGYRFRRRL